MFEQLAGRAISGAIGGSGSKPQALHSRTGTTGVNIGGFSVGNYESETVKMVKYAAVAVVAVVVFRKILK